MPKQSKCPLCGEYMKGRYNRFKTGWIHESDYCKTCDIYVKGGIIYTKDGFTSVECSEDSLVICNQCGTIIKQKGGKE